MGMSRDGALKRLDGGSTLASCRTFALARSADEALGLLAALESPPILDAAAARRAVGRDPFIVTNDEGFTIYKPWRDKPLREAPQEVAVGPAVSGRLVPTAYGCRLEVRVRKYVPAPSQRTSLVRQALVSAALFAMFLFVAGPHPVLLGIAAMVALGTTIGILTYRRESRAQDIRELLAIVERTFGPHELAARDDAPHRRVV